MFGNPRERGMNDRFFKRPFSPHYFGENEHQRWVIFYAEDMTHDQIHEYAVGYNSNFETIDYTDIDEEIYD